MARKPWGGEEHITSQEAEALADTGQLVAAAQIGGHWTITDIVGLFGGPGRGGGTRRLAEMLLEEKGIDDPSKTQLSNEMRNVNRYMQYEKTGVRNSNSFAPGADARKLVNAIGTQRAIEQGKGVHIHLNGPISVQGYKRDRTIDIYLYGDEAAGWLENPDWQTLADAYIPGDGEAELHGYDGVDIDVDFI